MGGSSAGIELSKGIEQHRDVFSKGLICSLPSTSFTKAHGHNVRR